MGLGTRINKTHGYARLVELLPLSLFSAQQKSNSELVRKCYLETQCTHFPGVKMKLFPIILLWCGIILSANSSSNFSPLVKKFYQNVVSQCLTTFFPEESTSLSVRDHLEEHIELRKGGGAPIVVIHPEPLEKGYFSNLRNQDEPTIPTGIVSKFVECRAEVVIPGKNKNPNYFMAIFIHYILTTNAKRDLLILEPHPETEDRRRDEFFYVATHVRGLNSPVIEIWKGMHPVIFFCHRKRFVALGEEILDGIPVLDGVWKDCSKNQYYASLDVDDFFIARMVGRELRGDRIDTGGLSIFPLDHVTKIPELREAIEIAKKFNFTLVMFNPRKLFSTFIDPITMLAEQEVKRVAKRREEPIT